MSASWKGKKRKIEEGREVSSPLITPGNQFIWRGGACSIGGRCNSGHHPLYLHLCDQSRDPQYLENRGLFVCIASCKLCKLFQEHMHSCLPWGWGWGIGSCCWAKSWNLAKITEIYYLTLPLRVANLSVDFQSSKVPKTPVFSVVSDSLPVQFCLGWKIDSWCFLPHHLLRILPICLLKYQDLYNLASILTYKLSSISSFYLFLYMDSLSSLILW